MGLGTKKRNIHSFVTLTDILKYESHAN